MAPAKTLGQESGNNSRILEILLIFRSAASQVTGCEVLFLKIARQNQVIQTVVAQAYWGIPGGGAYSISAM